jgi:hypothetical protein
MGGSIVMYVPERFVGVAGDVVRWFIYGVGGVGV